MELTKPNHEREGNGQGMKGPGKRDEGGREAGDSKGCMFFCPPGGFFSTPRTSGVKLTPRRGFSDPLPGRVFFDPRASWFSDPPWVFEAPQRGFSAPLLVFLSPKGVFLTPREGI